MKTTEKEAVLTSIN